MGTLATAKAPQNAFVYEPELLQLAEFDLGGVLYHANYFRLFERSREALLRSVQHPYPELVEKNFHFAVVESHQHFYQPVTYGMRLQVKLWVSKLQRASLQLEYVIESPDDKSARPLHYAWTQLVFISVANKNLQTTKIPEDLATALQTFVN